MKPRGRREPRALGGLVAGVLGDLGLDGVNAIVRVAERWEAAVGPEIARHCRPVAIRGATLEAAVDTSVWCHELSLQRRSILAALRRELGDDAPSELRLFVG